MATTSILTDTQLVILSHAARHPEGRVLPVPGSTGNKASAVSRTLKLLLRRQLVQEAPASLGDPEWARADNGKGLALTITPAGLAAIGVSEKYEQTVAKLVGEAVIDHAQFCVRACSNFTTSALGILSTVDLGSTSNTCTFLGVMPEPMRALVAVISAAGSRV